jgi:oxaloacetate decarboxylase gamma subunit
MNSLVSEGLNLMVYGMGFVFVFLTLLVIVTTLMSKLVNKFLPEPIVEPKAKTSAQQSTGNNDELLAVLTAAVHKYRK